MIHIKKNILKRLLPAALTLCCATAIFIFSMQNGKQSAQVSEGLLAHILAFVKNVSVNEITYEQISRYSFLIRKAAHFTIFFTLGIFSCWSAWGFFGKRHMLISLSFCVIYACTDEVHQLFSEGRGPAVKDVLIDSAGAFAGISLAAFVIFIFGKMKKDNYVH